MRSFLGRVAAVACRPQRPPDQSRTFRGGFPDYPAIGGCQAGQLGSAPGSLTRRWAAASERMTGPTGRRHPGPARQPASSEPARPRWASAPAGNFGRGCRVPAHGSVAVHGEAPGPVGGDRDADPGGAERPSRGLDPSSASQTARSGPSGRPRRGVPSIPRAWHSRPGPRHRSRSVLAALVAPAGLRASASRPATGRGPGAGPPAASPAGPHTTLAHQCTP